MTKEKENIPQQSQVDREELTLPRRGFLQRCALVTGVFVMGVLRLDKSFANTDSTESSDTDSTENIPEYCCSLLLKNTIVIFQPVHLSFIGFVRGATATASHKIFGV